MVAAVSALPGSTVAGLLLGILADRWLGTSPALAVTGLVLGFAAGIVSLFRTRTPPPADDADPPVPP